MGIDLTGYRRVMDSGDVRHIMKQHGDPVREQARTPPQLPVRLSDFTKLEWIIAHGVIVSVRSPKHGTRTVTYQATLGRIRYTLVEQVRTTAKQAALKSLWKQRV